MNFNIGDIFYIVLPEEADKIYFCIYQGVVTGYLSTVEDDDCTKAKITHYKTIIYNCPELLRFFKCPPFEGKNDPLLYLEDIGIPVEIEDSLSIRLDIPINTTDMHEVLYGALDEVVRLYGEE